MFVRPAPAGVAPHVWAGGEGGVHSTDQVGRALQAPGGRADGDRARVSQVRHWNRSEEWGQMRAGDINDISSERHH